MSYIVVDLVDVETGVIHEELFERSKAPETGVEFKHVLEGRERTVRRVYSVPQGAIVKEVECVAYSRPRWDPAFKHHTKRGFGVVRGKKDLQRVLDNVKRRSTGEEQEWTWDQE